MVAAQASCGVRAAAAAAVGQTTFSSREKLGAAELFLRSQCFKNWDLWEGTAAQAGFPALQEVGWDSGRQFDGSEMDAQHSDKRAGLGGPRL